MKIRLPNTSHRTTILGRTGTGKTVAGLWHLSNYSLELPWVILNFKNDEHIESIENAIDIDFDYIPKKKDKGIFVLHPTPQDAERPKAGEKSPLEIYLWKIWTRGRCGIFCDEAFLIGSNPAFDSCLVQGRSLKIPMIVCSQRPAWLTRFAFSESEFLQIFDLIDRRDKQTVEGFVPLDYSDEDELKEFHSWYFDVGKKKLYQFGPVPTMDETREIIDAKLKQVRKKRWFL